MVNRNFPPPSRLVYFGAFNRLMEALPRFQVIAQLPDEIMDSLREMINSKFGKGEQMATLEPSAATKQQGIVNKVYQAFFSPSCY